MLINYMKCINLFIKYLHKALTETKTSSPCFFVSDVHILVDFWAPPVTYTTNMFETPVVLENAHSNSHARHLQPCRREESFGRSLRTNLHSISRGRHTIKQAWQRQHQVDGCAFIKSYDILALLLRGYQFEKN